MAEDTDIKSISYKLYKIVNKEIGSKEIIKIRRTVNKVSGKLEQEENRGLCNHDHLSSGSRAEGFRFPTSDDDQMIVYNMIKVIVDDSTIQPFANITLLKMEIDQTRPGFCMLRFVSQDNMYDLDIVDLCVPYKDGLYLTNTSWKNRFARFIQDSYIHGPCESGIHGTMETDVAHCLKIKWPKSAYPCIKKLVVTRWPSHHCLSYIVQKGCHIVPIGDKTSCKEILEWRISFSEAEKNLIHEMNHCQFLTYGLLKMFLKEAINTYMRPDVDGLLCSYFIKTTVLWEVVYSGPAWRAQDLLKWFWICFRRLLSWVSDGYCPNFFIPENNMFLGKIYGRSQQNLLSHLASLHRSGYKCLLGCTSFFVEFVEVLLQPSNVVWPRVKEDSINVCGNLIVEIANKCTCVTLSSVLRCILLLERMVRENISSMETVVLYAFLQQYTRRFIFLGALQSRSHLLTSSTCNTIKYKTIAKYTNALKRSSCDASTHILFSAIIFYNHGMYHHVIRIVRSLKERLQSPYVMFIWNLGSVKYRELGGYNTPVEVMMRKFLIMDISFDKNTCLSELYLEHCCTNMNIPYSPMVLLNFLLYLSYSHLFLFSEATSVLQELVLLMNNDDGYHVYEGTRAISWEILGICQQMAGCFGEAYLSYKNALKEPYNNFFRKVTTSRIRNLNAILNNY